MKKSILLWVIAFLITAGTAVYQRMTGPTYPISGEVVFKAKKIPYKFLRTEEVGTDLEVSIETNDRNIEGIIFWKRFKTDDNWTQTRMNYENGEIIGYLPTQPAAGKLEYHVKLYFVREQLKVPEEENVVARYKGAVPIGVIIPHVFFMFTAMLLSTRTLLEALTKNAKLYKLTLWTIGFLFIGGLILGPIVQKYAFDAYWTGFPFGYDLTDNKTLIAFIAWGAAFFLSQKGRKKLWIIIAAVIMFVIFLIPHSMMGSELDYNKLDQQQSTNQIVE
ncbi:MAG: hypothetical protein K9J12_14435 [Melioribacteraceae bacterium]|nr:hypothetical protein [Melioribacteraceae bacterium]MCF8263694.1 hypothetical protein [Melioribacteraceae bacterium]MCF8414214.1 hypothetical protein [Melioribacteraceae bacterium]